MPGTVPDFCVPYNAAEIGSMLVPILQGRERTQSTKSTQPAGAEAGLEPYF